jgi:hypothetical protein
MYWKYIHTLHTHADVEETSFSASDRCLFAHIDTYSDYNNDSDGDKDIKTTYKNKKLATTTRSSAVAILTLVIVNWNVSVCKQHINTVKTIKTIQLFNHGKTCHNRCPKESPTQTEQIS